jgi:hypothetical protein
MFSVLEHLPLASVCKVCAAAAPDAFPVSVCELCVPSIAAAMIPSSLQTQMVDLHRLTGLDTKDCPLARDNQI